MMLQSRPGMCYLPAASARRPTRKYLPDRRDQDRRKRVLWTIEPILEGLDANSALRIIEHPVLRIEHPGKNQRHRDGRGGPGNRHQGASNGTAEERTIEQQRRRK